MSLNTENIISRISPLLEQISGSVSPRFQEPFGLGDPRADILDFKDLPYEDKQSLVQVPLKISGDFQGEAILLLDSFDALYLSGKLDNPDQESDLEKPGRSSFDQNDAQNIKVLVHAMAETFMEAVTSGLNINLSVDVHDPVMVDSPQTLSVPKKQLLVVTCSPVLGEKQLGSLTVVIPAALYNSMEPEHASHTDQDLMEANASLTPEELRDILADPETEITEGLNKRSSTKGDDHEAGQDQSEEPSENGDKEEHEGVDPAIIQKTLSHSMQNWEEELGDLMGKGVELTEEAFSIRTKHDVLSQHTEKLVVTKLLGSGEVHGEICTIISLTDAVYMGGTLLMLPEEETKRKIKTQTMGDDEADAFGEIINILAGNLSQSFGEYYPRRLHIKKDRMDTVAPTNIKASSSDPSSGEEYLYISYRMRMGSRTMGSLELMFPLPVLDISPKQKDMIMEGSRKTCDAEPPAVGILSENPEENKNFSPMLSSLGFKICYFNFRDNIKEKLRPYNVQIILLILKEVNEKNLAMLIKIQSLFRDKYPTVVAAPLWTRSQVIQAVQYGAHEIMVTPPEPESTQYKFEAYMPDRTAVGG